MSDKNLDRPAMQIQPPEWNEEFVCMMCGNMVFHPCDEEGTVIEKFAWWPGIYRCEGCGQRYWPVKS
jgi:uncharacterized protein with PIN domain